MEKIIYNVQLAVEIKDGRLIAHLKFTNDTGHEMTLDKYTICLDGKLRNNVFEITTDKGREVSYIGSMYKRKIAPEDSLPFQDGATISTTVVLNEGYELKVGKKYTIRYSANNHGACINSAKVYMEMLSNKVEILYK